MAKYGSLEERLVLNCVCHGDCFVWSGYCQDTYVLPPGTPGAYGRINLTRDGRSLKFPVHRVSKVLEELLLLVSSFNFYNKEHKLLFFDLYDAYSLSSLSIDHLCKNTLCLNPTHLEWVHLSKNQKRKLWSKRKRKLKIEAQKERETAHYKKIRNSHGVAFWIQQIRGRAHRIK